MSAVGGTRRVCITRGKKMKTIVEYMLKLV